MYYMSLGLTILISSVKVHSIPSLAFAVDFRSHTKKFEQQFVFFLRELLDRAVAGFFQNCIDDLLLELRCDLRIPESIHDW